MIEFTSVTKRYGALAALENLSFVVPRGATLALIGESASGKSTALRILAGLVRPDEGVVRVAGEPLSPKTLPSVRRRLGYVIQEGGLFPHLTAAENALLAARYVERRSPEWMRARAAELFDLMQLPAEAQTRYPAELSGGQRQRVALARALMLKPDILLLDEPFSALDPLIKRDLQRDVARIIATLDVTTVLVTHDIREARMFTAFQGGQIAVMRSGVAQQIAHFDELQRQPANDFVRNFVSMAF